MYNVVDLKDTSQAVEIADVSFILWGNMFPSHDVFKDVSCVAEETSR